MEFEARRMNMQRKSKGVFAMTELKLRQNKVVMFNLMF
jgi:hypothetical protein